MALTVPDMRVSAIWYKRVLGFDFVKDLRPRPVLLGSLDSSCCLGREPSCSACATMRGHGRFP